MVGMGFDCPVCGDGVELSSARGPLLARACDRCGGALLGPREVPRFRTAAVEAPRPPPRPASDLACPSCGGAIPILAIGETPYGECVDCGVAWVGRGPLLGWVIERLSRRPGAARAQPPSRPEPRRGRALAWVLAGVMLVVAVGAGAWVIRGGGLRALAAPGRPSPVPAPASSPQVVAASPAPAAEPAPPAPGATISAPAATPAPGPAAPPAAEAATPTVVAPAALGPIEELPVTPGAPRVLLAPRSGRTATLVIRFAGGALDDRLTGQTRVAQHALLLANRRMDFARFTSDLHAAAASMHMGTGVRDASFALTADTQDFEPLARALLTALLDPAFVPARMPNVLARARLDHPEPAGVLQSLAGLAGNDVRYRNPPVGSPDDVDAITAEDVASALRGRLAPASATVVVSGAFPREGIVRLLRSFHGGEAEPRGPVQLTVPFATRRQSPRELHLLAYPFSARTPRQAACARVLAQLISDALWRKIRMVGVGYVQDATAVRSDWVELLLLAVAARDESIDLGPVLLDLVREIREGHTLEADFLRARAAVRAELQAIDAEPAALAWTLATAGPSWQGQEVAQEVERLDRGALVEVARPWLDPASSIYVYQGTRK